MSITDELSRLVMAGKLHPLKLTLPSDRSVRRMFLTSEMQQLIDGPWISRTWESRCWALRATLESFVKGERFTVSLTPYEHGDADIGRLDKPKDEVWDIRCRKTRPGLRVFGRFIEKDTFIATNFAPRSVVIPGVPQMPLLDQNTSMEWDFAILESQKQWASMFPSTNPIHKDQASDYLSNAISL
jgi:hypothetical protein